MADAKIILFDKMFQRFITQNPEDEFFDVVFEIDGKKLYADKFRLSAVSETFQSMLSKRWNSKNEPIVIKDYSFENFKEFLTFIYSGECSNLTDENIFVMIDIAEFYNIEILKTICDEYASKMEISNENAFQMLELAIKYSLIQLKKTAVNYFQKNFVDLTASDKFLSFDRTNIKEFIAAVENDVKPEEFFEAIYKWGEHQANLKKAASNDDQNFNMNDAIKNELSEFLPNIKFRKMKLTYLHKFVVVKAFIFSSFEELSDILCTCNSDITVKATSPTGQILKGILANDHEAIKNIKSLKNSVSIYNHNFDCFWWNSIFTIPSTPSQLNKKDDIEWYLIYLTDGRLAIRNRSEIAETNYLIAEMFCETTVTASAGWKIEIL